MKSSSVALFLALSAGYLGAASADTLIEKPHQTGHPATANSSEQQSVQTKPSISISEDESAPPRSPDSLS